MLDIKAIRLHPSTYKETLARKGVDPLRIDELLAADEIRRSLKQTVEEAKAKQNEVSKKIPTLTGDEKQNVLAQMKELSENRKKDEMVLEEAEQKWMDILESLPLPPHESVPDGGEEDSIVLESVGKQKDFGFKPKEHWELAEKLDLLDTERSAKISGSRFYFLKNELAILQRALIQWALLEMTKKGFTPMITPVLVREEAMKGTGFLSKADKNEIYTVNPGEDNLYLIGTSEVPLTAYHSDEILEEAELPKTYAGHSLCFRREAGSYGKDTKGIFRVHQFEKVEMVVLCTEEASWDWHDKMREIEQDLFNQLEIPYNVMNIAAGDLGGSAAKKYDIEAWIPSQESFREMTSTSNCLDFQARRLNIRYRTKDGELKFVHTLNGTVTSSRPLVAILENYQNEDGSIDVPKVLQPYCGFEKIKSRDVS